jgi:hypothetical protein
MLSALCRIFPGAFGFSLPSFEGAPAGPLQLEALEAELAVAEVFDLPCGEAAVALAGVLAARQEPALGWFQALPLLSFPLSVVALRQLWASCEVVAVAGVSA